jgi:hypothetical protein
MTGGDQGALGLLQPRDRRLDRWRGSQNHPRTLLDPPLGRGDRRALLLESPRERFQRLARRVADFGVPGELGLGGGARAIPAVVRDSS